MSAVPALGIFKERFYISSFLAVGNSSFSRACVAVQISGER